MLAGLGACAGVYAKAIPALYVSLVAIGAVALLSLAFNELIIEAHESIHKDNKNSNKNSKLWVQKLCASFMFFAGIWVIVTFAKFE